MLGEVRCAAFAALVGKQCELQPEGGQAFMVEVASATERPNARMARAAPDARMPFSVILRGPARPDFVGGICALRAEGLAELQGVHVERIVGDDPDPRQACYQIVFN